ncbi:MAG: FHA domain-containing serine/threonine-protein kinase [Planctomycetota bacterium]|nr:FHA domain-containing serine/threonine-protein kinase [Planctomycetota bacterium]
MSYNRKKLAPRLGELAKKMAGVSARDLKECVQLQVALKRTGRFKMLGGLLIERGYLEQEKLDELLEEQRNQGIYDVPEIPDYTIKHRIGAGGMAQVFLANQVKVNRDVALKIVTWEDPEGKDVARFLREAKSAAKLNHPNFVQAIDFGQVNETYFFAMEYIAGPNLQEILNLYNRLSEVMSLNIANQVATALCRLEEEDLIHRDLKPTNILLDGDTVKVCDLGLARPVFKEDGEEDFMLTEQGAILGTPDYLSPEQARSLKDIDIRADLYALGGMLYRMVTGKLPYRGESPTSLIYRKLYEPVVPPKVHMPDLSDGTAFLIEKLMERKRENRFQTAKEVLSEGRACLNQLTSETKTHLEIIGSETGSVLESPETRTRAPSELRPALLFISGAAAGRHFPLTRDETIVGRQSSCNLCIREPWFSRRHFAIRRRDDTWQLSDLGSRNGVKVNGKTVDKARIHYGDEIEVKDTKMMFVLEVDSTGETRSV